MKNVKLNGKLLFLTIILSAVAVFIAWVGISRLKVLDSKMQSLGNQTLQRVVSAGDFQVKLLSALREQKNATLIASDQESEKYASASRNLVAELSRDVTALSATINDADERLLMNEFDLALREFAKVNEDCLKLAVQNTNVKALNELHGRATEALKKALVQIQTIETTLQTKNDPASMEACRTISNELQEMIRVADQHISISVGDSRFTEVDQQLKSLLEKIPASINKLQELCKSVSVSSSELADSLGTLRSSVSEVHRLSTLDSNNRSVAMTLTSARDAASAAIAACEKLVRAYKLRSDKDVGESSAIYAQSLRYILFACGAGLVLGFAAAFWISRSITIPIAKVRDITQNMSTGDLSSRIELLQTDEVGELATATDSLASALSDIVREIQKTSAILGTSSGNLGQISSSLESQSEETLMRSSSVAAAAEELSANINSMSAAAEQMSMNFSSISSATEELSASVGAISSAAEQTSSNVTNVANAVQDISKSFGDVLGDVQEGSRVAGQATQMAESAGRTMRDLDKSSTEISKFTETIKMIALQTNLLALNATIEATSAGEAGKGFAVVAHEIKELANQSAKAAEDIAKKIEDVQNGTGQAVEVIQGIAEVIKTINQSADRISHSVENQNQSARTISQNIVEANQGVGHIARSIAEVAKATNDMSRNIAEASRGAKDVSRNVGEGARASSGISESIVQVSSAAKQTNTSANGVTETAKQLERVSVELRNLVARFKISRNGNS